MPGSGGGQRVVAELGQDVAGLAEDLAGLIEESPALGFIAKTHLSAEAIRETLERLA